MAPRLHSTQIAPRLQHPDCTWRNAKDAVSPWQECVEPKVAREFRKSVRIAVRISDQRVLKNRTDSFVGGNKKMSHILSSQHKELLGRIEAFIIDEGKPELSFSHRLARENGWTRDYAERVVAEYLRFVGLAMVSGHLVTPSEQVDQAWHLHLTYTQSYWTRLCGEVLRRPLHHGPTRGGIEESRKYWRQYERTLQSYEEVFGIRPPEDIWRTAEIRFGSDLQTVRVNPADYWVIPKVGLRRLGPRRWRRVLVLFSLGVLIVPAVWGALAERGVAARERPFGLSRWLTAASWTASESTFFQILSQAFWIAVLPAEFLFRPVVRAMDNRQGNGLQGFDVEAEVSGISRAEAAILMRGVPRLVEAALGALVAGRRCRVVEETETIEPVAECSEGLQTVDVHQTSQDFEGELGARRFSRLLVADRSRLTGFAGAEAVLQTDDRAEVSSWTDGEAWDSITAAVLKCLPLEKKDGVERVQGAPGFAAVARKLQANLQQRRLMATDPHRWGRYLGLPAEWVVLLMGAVCCAVLAVILYQAGLTGDLGLCTFLVALIVLVIWPALRLGLQQGYHPVTARGMAVVWRLFEVMRDEAEHPLIHRDPTMAIAVHGSESLVKSKDPELQRLHHWLTPASSGHSSGCGGGGG